MRDVRRIGPLYFLSIAIADTQSSMTSERLGGPMPSRGGRRPPRAISRALAAAAVVALLGACASAAVAAPQCTGTCAGKNWCEDRTDTCGSGRGKCFVRRFGGNICAKILFQTNTCADCQPPNCLNCVCVLGAGGGDKCNNGVNGFDYICVRGVRR